MNMKISLVGDIGTPTFRHFCVAVILNKAELGERIPACSCYYCRFYAVSEYRFIDLHEGAGGGLPWLQPICLFVCLSCSYSVFCLVGRSVAGCLLIDQSLAFFMLEYDFGLPGSSSAFLSTNLSAIYGFFVLSHDTMALDCEVTNVDTIFRFQMRSSLIIKSSLGICGICVVFFL